MSALTGPRITRTLGVPVGGPIPNLYPSYRGIADNVVIYAGAMMAIDSTGYARPARGGTNSDIIVGVAQPPGVSYDNTVSGHAAGFPVVNGIPLFPNGIEAMIAVAGWTNDTGGGAILASTQVGTTIYALDDQTATLTAGSNSKAGKLWGLDPVSSLVYVIPEIISWA